MHVQKKQSVAMSDKSSVYIDKFGDESFRTISGAGTDNQTHNQHQ